ncbi:MAG: fibronectin type III domain-containing protein [Eubacterium sp.]|nr:fibronectin type III domain-containing protein [Eubacterium sp.]
MKRLLAVLMTTIMIVSCMPVMAFADDAGTPSGTPEGTAADTPADPSAPADPEQDRYLIFVDTQISALLSELRDVITSPESLAYYDKVSSLIKDYQPFLDDLSEKLKSDPDSADYKEALSTLDAVQGFVESYIKELRDRKIEEFKESEEIQTALKNLEEKLVALDSFLKQYDPDYSKEYQEDLSAILDKVLEAKGDLRDAAFRDLIKEALQEFIAESKDFALDMRAGLFTKENLIKYLSDVQTIQKIVEYIQVLKPDATIRSLVNTAEEFIKKNAEAIANKGNEKKHYQNALKVVNLKPALSSVKAKKGKKAVVSFKGLKDAEATAYQISYKTGKKTKTATLKKSTTSDESLKYTLKGLKKGKKYTVKVRAVYEFTAGGQAYKIVSKWSKAKKVKAK